MCTFFMDVIYMYEKYMLEALKEAELAYQLGEVPIGSIIVCDNQIIARSHNTRNFNNDIFGHAEINVINETSNIKLNWRLENCVLYVTLLPCPMCASAINQSRIKKVVCGTVPNNVNYSLIYNILNDNSYGKPVEIVTGVLEDECADLLKKFFSEKR